MTLHEVKSGNAATVAPAAGPGSAPGTPSTPAHTPRRVLVALIVMAVLINGAFAGARTALPLFAIKLGASTFTVGVLMALVALVPATIALRMGRFLDRMGPRRPMLIGSAGVMVALLAAFAFGRLPALFVCAITMGTFGSLFFMSHTQAIGKLSTPESRTSVLAMSAMGFSVSSFAGPVVAGLSIDHVGHGPAMAILALLPAAAVAALAFRLLPIADSTSRSFATAHKGHFTDFFRERATRRVYMAGIVSNTAWECLNLMVPVYGHSVGLSATSIGVVLGAFSVGTFSVRMLLPVLARRMKSWRLLSLAFICSGLGYALLPTTSLVELLIPFAFIIGLGLGASQPMVTSLLFETAPESRIGEALGLRTAMVNVGATVFPLALGGLGSLIGIPPIFWGMSCLIASGATLAWRVRT